jgi:hypothetical protein
MSSDCPHIEPEDRGVDRTKKNSSRGSLALRFAKALVGGDKECVVVGVSMEREL